MFLQDSNIPYSFFNFLISNRFGIFDKIFKSKKSKESQKEPASKEKVKDDKKSEKEEQLEQEIIVDEQQEKALKSKENKRMQEKASQRDQTIIDLESIETVTIKRQQIIKKVQQQQQPQPQQVTDGTEEVPALVDLHTSHQDMIIRSFSDKLDDITELPDGKVIHNVFKKNGTARDFKDKETFLAWKRKLIKERKEYFKTKLTPQQFYVTQGVGTERPFTGEHWWTKDVGIYSCVCCSQRVFMSDHKYESTSGFPTFWNHIVDAIKYKEDHLELPKVTQAHQDPLLKNKIPIKRITCSNCESHLGHVFADGPAPFGKRFQINSAALQFLQKPWFQAPPHLKLEKIEIKKRQYISKKGLTEFNELLENEKLLGLISWKDKKVEKPKETPVFNLKGSISSSAGSKRLQKE